MLLDPILSLILAFTLLGLLFYKRVSVGIILIIVPSFLALLTLDLRDALSLLYATINPFSENGLFAALIILSTFFIAWLSFLYEDSGEIRKLSNSLNSLIKRPNFLLTVSPAVMSFLPIAGGALLSAPLVSSLIKNSNVSLEKGSYINLWFRHILVPVYPLGQAVILTSALTGIPLLTVILLQVPIITTMIIVGYLFGLRGNVCMRSAEIEFGCNRNATMLFIKSFMPILLAITVAVTLNALLKGLIYQGVSLLIASLLGLVTLIVVSPQALRALRSSLSRYGIYDITLAVYGAFLFQNVMAKADVPAALKPLTLSDVGVLSLLALIPFIMSFLMGSIMGSVTISISMLTDVITFTPKVVMLLYTGANLGYLISPVHLCLVFTLRYFNVTIQGVYRYAIPSTIITYLIALLLFTLLPT
ncbi:MAG: DUF401 family protein [Candidatus Nezhaarchaeota archaeon]|nr:DUF401 family protein [Candidatus Nezhaarchaeota archaeon]MCX8142146.1 DUF401 family protein [Candidatus Nezhaarchaeota archaeon]MDW8050073.1 DUF401 family protein [Nitrososphaerota archaeon]